MSVGLQRLRDEPDVPTQALLRALVPLVVVRQIERGNGAQTLAIPGVQLDLVRALAGHAQADDTDLCPVQ